jgi:hypothetical protein
VKGNNIFSNFGSKTFDSLAWNNHASCFKQSIFLLGAIIFLLEKIGSWRTGVGSRSGRWNRETRQTTKGRRSREKATSFVGCFVTWAGPREVYGGRGPVILSTRSPHITPSLQGPGSARNLNTFFCFRQLSSNLQLNEFELKNSWYLFTITRGEISSREMLRGLGLSTLVFFFYETFCTLVGN